MASRPRELAGRIFPTASSVGKAEACGAVPGLTSPQSTAQIETMEEWKVEVEILPCFQAAFVKGMCAEPWRYGKDIFAIDVRCSQVRMTMMNIYIFVP